MAITTPELPGQTGKHTPGLAWDVRGGWKAAGSDGIVHTGSAVWPGSLLLPDPTAAEHSITVMLPDGQHLIFQCYTVEDCSRGFRVPLLYRNPTAFAVDLLGRVRATVSRNDLAEGAAQAGGQLPQDEEIGVVGPGNTVHLQGLISAMQNGRYTYSLRSLSQPGTTRKGLVFDKTSRSVPVVVPGPGLYDMTITDSLSTPRIDVLVAAITASQQGSVAKPFQEAGERLKDWNEEDQGWPMHEIEHAYLASLMLKIVPQPSRHTMGREPVRPGTTAEPRFSPQPGNLNGPTGIELHCDTPGAVIHYTNDYSQPSLSSPVYEAPIIAKRTTLTIKAFATAPGKKDSAVIVGTFRPGD